MGDEKKPILLSGIQPTGNLTIGNLIGAIRNWRDMQEAYDCLFVIVDLHAITVRQEPKDLRKRCLDFLAQYLACGLDPIANTVFIQSHVPAHAELAWILACHTYMGELSRMTQYKDKSARQGSNIGTGLFAYPSLMAADILLYGTHVVPVGEDQRQHLELTRDLAQRFNRAYGETFRVPKAYIPPVGGRVMSLTDPTSKMSKTDPNPKSYVALLDPPDIIRARIKKAVTDSGAEIRFAPEEQPAISNLMVIRCGLTGEFFDAVREDYAGKGYGEFKEDLAEVVVKALRPIQERYREIRSDKAGLERIMAEGAGRAERRARPLLEKVKRKIGLLPRPADR